MGRRVWGGREGPTHINIEGDENSDAEKNDRADGEGFLDAETIQFGLGDGQFGGSVASEGEEHYKNAGGGGGRALEKGEVEQAQRGGDDEKGESERGEPEEDIRAAQRTDGFPLHLLALRRGDVASPAQSLSRAWARMASSSDAL